ncbi:MAG: hypothetical protein AB1806_02140 [Acidobacteriota bacterium]
MTLPMCAVPGCVALASRGAFCAAHRWAVEELGRRRLSQAQAREYLEELVREFRTRYTRLSKYLVHVERLPLPLPCLLDFEFHSPRAALLVSESIEPSRLPALLAHEFRHLARQVRRYRRRAAPGAVPPSDRLGGRERYVPWEGVESGRHLGEVQLPARRRRQLTETSGSCPSCALPAPDLQWTYVVSPAPSWTTLGGFAGWLAVCATCHEQVAFYIDKQN